MKKTVFAIAPLLFALTVTADPGTVQPVGFDDIKIACQNPSRFQNQVAPSSIQVTCHDVQYRWVPESDGALDLATSREITTSVVSDKYEVAPLSAMVPTASQTMACPQYKLVSEVVDSVRAVSCDELIAFNGTATDFCSESVNGTRAANANAIVITDTGKKLSLCADKSTRGQH